MHLDVAYLSILFTTVLNHDIGVWLLPTIYMGANE